jgi:hypothetical protein
MHNMETFTSINLMFLHPDLVRRHNRSILWIIERDFPRWVEKPI